MIRTFIIGLLFFIGIPASATDVVAAGTDILKSDSINIEPISADKVLAVYEGDTITPAAGSKETKKIESAPPLLTKKEWKPDSKKALLYSLIPGMGQAYNRKYWKLPIVYGGYLGLAYAITWNGSQYDDYSRAYKSVMLGTDEWRTIFPYRKDRDPESMKSTFKRGRDNFRRNRDLAIIASVGLYALCMIDAYVDSQLYDFDISPDLSMRVEPIISAPTQYSGASVGLLCNITF